ncbi:cystathione beta-lyase [Thalassobacillus cyri]|uniref:cysteine-S-conjugate beta-lyase n=1 Tax=Thalassobacillus cyri TaxID=571932 RepID=A0A1H4G8X1_9BACI|nr:MalY/PatB family protein [Thalassobacillus cyri]SEB06039.1 cystathione beta-lyase [Thalassobacillus cyri]
MSRFTEVRERTGTRSVKWDMTEKLFKSNEVLPMWVADMDFQAPQAVIDALTERAAHGIFGYTITDELVEGTIYEWLKRQYGWTIDTKWISYSPGVVPSLHMIVQALTKKGDNLLIQTPVYPPFYKVIEQHDRNVITNKLMYKDNRYEIDYEDFENKIVENEVKAFILCNPHNPVGRVWTEKELKKMADICLKHDVLIFSDEIHSDLVLSGHKHLPIASLSEEISKKTITCLSPTKTFNLAGLQASYVVTANDKLKKPMDEMFHAQGMHMLNTMGITALEAAYKHGEAWLKELLEVIEDNKNFAKKYLNETDQIEVVEPEGTYLLWLDCRKMGMEHDELKRFMQETAKVGLNDGASFGIEGEGFMRMNIACPKATLEEGVNRIVKAVKNR